MNKRDRLKQYVTKAHEGQTRIGGEDYINHLTRVAEASESHFYLGWEVGLCHDLFEDTEVRVDDLSKSLKSFGYTDNYSRVICETVLELTDKFTRDRYPNLKRVERKKRESYRLSEASYMAQTVKLEDIYDNLMSYEVLGKGFLPVYLNEKLTTLKLMVNCNGYAKRRAWRSYMEALGYLTKGPMGENAKLWLDSLDAFTKDL